MADSQHFQPQLLSPTSPSALYVTTSPLTQQLLRTASFSIYSLAEPCSNLVVFLPESALVHLVNNLFFLPRLSRMQKVCQGYKIYIDFLLDFCTASVQSTYREI